MRGGVDLGGKTQVITGSNSVVPDTYHHRQTLAFRNASCKAFEAEESEATSQARRMTC